ncbi:MAG: hypothetical protein AB1730_20495 [Myxococcota bacterium]|jgi:hypothetical protein
MNPIVHAELSWLTGQRLGARRDRLLVTLAGLSPGLDGLSLLAGEDAYSRWHHVLTHGFLSALACAVVCAAFAQQKRLVALRGCTPCGPSARTSGCGPGSGTWQAGRTASSAWR